MLREFTYKSNPRPLWFFTTYRMGPVCLTALETILRRQGRGTLKFWRLSTTHSCCNNHCANTTIRLRSFALHYIANILSLLGVDLWGADARWSVRFFHWTSYVHEPQESILECGPWCSTQWWLFTWRTGSHKCNPSPTPFKFKTSYALYIFPLWRSADGLFWVR